MDTVLDLLQAAGIAAAIGIRPFLPVLLVGLLATGDLGLDFDGTDWAFLEDWWFLVLIAVLGAIDLVRELRGGGRPDVAPLWWIFIAPALILAAFEGAGSLADRDHSIILGIVAGVLAAMLGYYAAKSLFDRVRRRLDAEAAAVLPVYGEAAALVAAGLSVLFPPLAILILAGLAWLLAGGRRRAGEKYAGLRILR